MIQRKLIGGDPHILWIVHYLHREEHYMGTYVCQQWENSGTYRVDLLMKLWF